MRKKKVLMMTNSVGCSTKIKVSCTGLHACACKPMKRNVPRKVDKHGKEYVRETLSRHEVNTKMALGALVMGVCGKEITTIMAMLDLTHAKYFNSCAFSVVKDEIGVLLQDAALKAMEKGSEEEIKLTLKEKHK
eukprot:5354162-Ditylum_brightwellii.AAC.1